MMSMDVDAARDDPGPGLLTADAAQLGDRPLHPLRADTQALAGPAADLQREIGPASPHRACTRPSSPRSGPRPANARPIAPG